MRETWVVIACALAACKGQSGSSAKGESGDSETLEGEIAVVLGDCAPAGTPFVSGPEPQSFKPEDLAKPATTLYATMSAGGDVIAAYEGSMNIYGGLLGNEAGEMQGGFGFGRSGFGPGGGGQGWGTIGTGKYGTIGRGTGTGYGIGGSRGGLRGRSASLPTVTLGQPAKFLPGDLDPAIVRRYIKRNFSKITYCYEKELLAKPKLEGKITTTFVIAQSGSVTSAEAEGFDKNVSSCVAGVIKGIEFPKPKNGIVKVVYPFIFRPTDDSSPTPPPSPTPPSPTPSPPATTPDQDKAQQQAIDQARSAGIIGVPGQGGAFASLTAAIPTSKPYQPGAASALAELRILLLDCFRKQDKRHAAVVFDLAPGAITAHGIDHPAFNKCLASIGSQVKVTTPLRCAATFGTGGVGSLPAIDVTADAIMMFGKKVTEPVAVMAGDPDPWWKIESVSKAAQERVKATIESKAPLTLHGPIVVRPLPATPMKVVTKLVHTLIAAGEDPLLAAQRNGAWQLVRNYQLPVVPVPTGTGGSWNSDSPGDSIFAGEDDVVRLSVLVEKNDVWVAPSLVEGGKRVPFAKLKAELAAYKAGKHFADREDIEIAGADDVPYSRVIEAIDIASGAGFRAWSVTSPIGLSAPAPAADAGSAAAP
jgi:hypothetical protein